MSAIPADSDACGPRSASDHGFGTLPESAVTHALPSFNVFGTFFPAWMLCALIGIGGAIVAFKVVSALHATGFLRVPLIFYPCVALAITSLVWLGWYGR